MESNTTDSLEGKGSVAQPSEIVEALASMSQRVFDRVEHYPCDTLLELMDATQSATEVVAGELIDRGMNGNAVIDVFGYYFENNMSRLVSMVARCARSVAELEVSDDRNRLYLGLLGDLIREVMQITEEAVALRKELLKKAQAILDTYELVIEGTDAVDSSDTP